MSINETNTGNYAGCEISNANQGITTMNDNTKNSSKTFNNGKGIEETSYVNNTNADLITKKSTADKLTTDAINKSKCNAISDHDMRELLKTLIRAFAKLATSQRESDLYNLTKMIDAFKNKIKAMEDSKSAQYKATMASAVASIIGGAISIGLSAKGAFSTIKGLKASGLNFEKFQMNTNTIWGKVATDASSPVGQIISAFGSISSAKEMSVKNQAEIEQTVQDQVLEIIRKSQDQNSSMTKALTEYMSSIVAVLQQLQQSVSSTEKSIAQV